MVQATARAKAQRAENSKTRLSGELLELKPGDLVDFHRPPATKDHSGWMGPAVVADVTPIPQGIIAVRWQGRTLDCRIQDIRRALVYPVFLAVHSSDSPVMILRMAVESSFGSCTRVGWFKQQGNWQACEANKTSAKVLLAGLYVAGVCLNLQGAVGFRFGRNIRTISAVQCDDSFIMWWTAGDQSCWRHAFLPATSHINLVRLTGLEESKLCFAQYFMLDSQAVSQLRVVVSDIPNVGGPYEPDLPELREAEMPNDNRNVRRIRSIADGAVSNEVANTPNATFDEQDLGDDNEELLTYNTQDELRSIVGQGTLDVESASAPPVAPTVNAFVSDEVYVIPEDDSESESAELVFTSSSSQYLTNAPFVSKDHELAFEYNREELPTAVIQRVNHLISRDEALQHVSECRAAMIKELERWSRHKAWQRRPRAGSQNVLQSRWVLKWKNMQGSRGVKARLVVQGFQDRQETQTFAGTSSRWGQRLLLILATQFEWDLLSLDVSEAFLRGISFKELHQDDPSKPLRQVQLKLPPGCGVLFRSLGGMEDFCEETEVLEMLKPGFGLKDAPRLWNKALRKVLGIIGVRAIATDNQLYVKHDSKGVLILAISVHVDDLKLTGIVTEMLRAKKVLEDHFDELKCESGSFEHLGLAHSFADGRWSVDQSHYAKELKLIPESDLRLHPDDLASAEVAKLYMSLLGGVAWLAQTRLDICVFVAALQRRLKSPRGQDVINLNRIVKYVQKNPLKLMYSKVPDPWKMLAISDSSYQSKDGDGLAMRSGIIVLTNKEGLKKGNNIVQLLECVSRKQSRVRRSTYAAELYSALDLIGMGININLGLTEVLSGIRTASELADILERGQNLIPLECVIDARSVLDSVSQEEVKTPNDKIMFIHALKLREHLDRNQISQLTLG